MALCAQEQKYRPDSNVTHCEGLRIALVIFFLVEGQMLCNQWYFFGSFFNGIFLKKIRKITFLSWEKYDSKGIHFKCYVTNGHGI